MSKKRKNNAGVHLALAMFKRNVSTSKWTDDDAVTYFNMGRKIGACRVLRIRGGDTQYVEWAKDRETGEVTRHDVKPT